MKIYLLAGVPASGKTWVCEQLRDSFEYIPHDDYIKHGKNHTKAYIHDIERMSKWATKPLLIETPFSISILQNAIEDLGVPFEVICIIEDHDILVSRYSMRAEDERDFEYKEGNFTRQKTYLQRADQNGWFHGTSQETLDYLRSK